MMNTGNSCCFRHVDDAGRDGESVTNQHRSSGLETSVCSFSRMNNSIPRPGSLGAAVTADLKTSRRCQLNILFPGNHDFITV